MARQVVRHDFSNIGGASAKNNLVGGAIGEIGEVLKGLDVPSFEKDQEPNKTSPDLSGFEEPAFNVEAQQLGGDTSILDSLTGQPFKSRPVGNISNPPALSPTSTNPYQPIDISGLMVRSDTVGSVQTHLDPTRGSGLPGAGALERGPNQYNILRGESPFNRNGKDKGKEILGRNDKGEVKVKDARGKEVWVTEAPEGSEEQYEQYLQTFRDQRGPDAQPLDIHHAAASGFASPAQSLLAYKSGGRALGKQVGQNRRVPTLQDLETIGLADHPLMKKAYPQLFNGSGGMTEESPINRNSPFYRTKVDLTTENISAATGPGYLGADPGIRGAAVAGFNAVVDRHNYKQQVWADKAAEADLEFGKLEQEPSGVSAWDSSVEIMAREWKSNLGDLLKNKNNLDPQEFISKKQEILARSKQFNTAAGMLQKVVGDYNENLDNISAGTDPDVMDLLNTLNKGGGKIGVSNVNGIPTMTGKTNMGKSVSIPISEIASGRGQLRFAIKEDIQPGLDKITQNLSKIKRDRAIAGGGLATSTVGWDQLKSSAEPQIDALVNKASTVRAIMADRFGLDYDDLKEQFPKVNPRTGQVEADIDKARAEAKRMLMEDLQKQISPYQQAATIKRDPRVANETKASAVDVRSAADARAISGQINQIPDNNFNAEGLQQFVGGNINGIQQLEGGSIGVVLKNGKGVKLNPNPKVARQQLARILGIDERHVGQVGSALPRVAEEASSESPFKRLMNFMTSPFKRDGKGKKSKVPEGADPVTPTLGFEGYEEDPDRIVHLGDDVEAAHREAGGHVTESGGLVQTGGGLSEFALGAGGIGAKLGGAVGGLLGIGSAGRKASLAAKLGTGAAYGAIGAGTGAYWGTGAGLATEPIVDAVQSWESPAEKRNKANAAKAKATELKRAQETKAQQARLKKLQATNKKTAAAKAAATARRKAIQAKEATNLKLKQEKAKKEKAYNNELKSKGLYGKYNPTSAEIKAARDTFLKRMNKNGKWYGKYSLEQAKKHLLVKRANKIKDIKKKYN